MGPAAQGSHVDSCHLLFERVHATDLLAPLHGGHDERFDDGHDRLISELSHSNVSNYHLDILSQLKSSSKELAASLRFFFSVDSHEHSLDEEIFSVLIANRASLSIFSELNSKGLLRISPSDTKAQKLATKLSNCRLQASICMARIGNKSLKIQNHVDSMAKARLQLLADDEMLSSTLNHLSSVWPADKFAALASEILPIQEEIRIYLDRIDSHVEELKSHLAVARDFGPSALNLEQMVEKSHLLRPRLERKALEDLEIASRATDPLLSLENLETIERFRALPENAAKKMTGIRWRLFMRPLLRVNHWRASQEIIRLTDFFAVKNSKLVKESFKRLSFDKKLQPVMALLKNDRFVMETLFAQGSSQDRLAVAYSLKGHRYGYLEKHLLHAAVQPELFPVVAGIVRRNIEDAKRDGQQYPHEQHDVATELDLLSKFVSSQSIEILETVIAMTPRSAVFDRLAKTRDAMKLRLSKLGEHTTSMPVSEMAELLPNYANPLEILRFN